MSSLFKGKNCIIFFLVLILLLSFPACAEHRQESSQEENASISDTSDASENALGLTFEDDYIIEEAYIPHMPLDALMEDTTLVIQGKVRAVSDAFYVRSVDGEGRLQYEDYTVEIMQVFRGEAEVSGTVTVRMESNNDPKIIRNFLPDLQIGDEYLLFLLKATCGGSFRTEGDYYLVSWHRNGVFAKIDTDASMKKAGIDIGTDYFASQYTFDDVKDFTSLSAETKVDILRSYKVGSADLLTAVSLQDIAKRYDTLYPVDENRHETMILENIEANLANGIISEEEYNQMKKQMNQYATIEK